MIAWLVQELNDQVVKIIGFFHVDYMATVGDHRQTGRVVFGHKVANGRQKHMVFGAHDIQSRQTTVFGLEEGQKRFQLGNEGKPAVEFLLRQFPGFIDE